ncbi:NAD-dependent epimerase/dehydratase family protein [Ruminiclostridium josui]|uniref:NAD-dependent epimerase/dehydratase family protein n=1 Tax=Ruminiclostridium josui TaxID=1499 RepID=UPI0004659E14|nr:NAD-dependent epimerase/dehydratase family protein [Ruminiclostridium josui]
MDKYIKEDCMEYLKKIDLSPLYNKTVLITGANGLIGTYIIYMLHLANILKGGEIKIYAVSRSKPCEALTDIFEQNYSFYSEDLNSMDIDKLKVKIDYIIHGATYAQPGKFLRNYLDTIHLNTIVTEKLLQRAKKDNSVILFLSSSEIYGEPDIDNIPTPESYPGFCSPINVRAVYSESKRMGETLCFAYRHYEGVDAKVARISMTYGPGVKGDDERVLGQFIRRGLEQKNITMLDDGSKVRTFCYIADCALMLMHIIAYGKDFVYNVGGQDSISIKTLAQEVCSITGSTLTIDNQQKKQTIEEIKVSPDKVQLDISKILSEFGIISFKPFREGLERTVEWNKDKWNLQMK